jgi:hypothetical protein
MSTIDVADRSLFHLFPPFAQALQKIIDQANHETAGKHGVSHWTVEETFRSQARQNHLYAQGRTAPGPIVTHLHVSPHTSGMAADCYPVDVNGQIMWEPHPSIWDQFAHCVRCQPGLQSGHDYPKITGGTFVDSPHVEPDAHHRALWAAEAHAYLVKMGLI